MPSGVVILSDGNDFSTLLYMGQLCHDIGRYAVSLESNGLYSDNEVNYYMWSRVRSFGSIILDATELCGNHVKRKQSDVGMSGTENEQGKFPCSFSVPDIPKVVRFNSTSVTLLDPRRSCFLNPTARIRDV